MIVEQYHTHDLHVKPHARNSLNIYPTLCMATRKISPLDSPPTLLHSSFYLLFETSDTSSTAYSRNKANTTVVLSVTCGALPLFDGSAIRHTVCVDVERVTIREERWKMGRRYRYSTKSVKGRPLARCSCYGRRALGKNRLASCVSLVEWKMRDGPRLRDRQVGGGVRSHRTTQSIRTQKNASVTRSINEKQRKGAKNHK